MKMCRVDYTTALKEAERAEYLTDIHADDESEGTYMSWKVNWFRELVLIADAGASLLSMPRQTSVDKPSPLSAAHQPGRMVHSGEIIWGRSGCWCIIVDNGA